MYLSINPIKTMFRNAKHNEATDLTCVDLYTKLKIQLPTINEQGCTETAASLSGIC